MDSTAGDLSHAAQEIGVVLEEQASRELSNGSRIEKGVSNETQGAEVASSSSSSSQDPGLEKLDSKIIKIGDTEEGEEAYAHLLPEERNIIKRQLDTPSVKITYKTLYRYATKNDLLIVIISAICAIAGGAVMPLMTVYFSSHERCSYVDAERSKGYLWPIDWLVSRLYAWHVRWKRAQLKDWAHESILHISCDR